MHNAGGKVIIITGASAGIGRAIAIEAGRRKAKVALLARRYEILEEVRDIIKESGGDAAAIQTDMRQPRSVKKAFRTVDSLWGRMDILFNNAGVLEPIAPILYTSDASLVNSLKTNVLGVYVATREALKRMLKQAEGGTILSITSGAAIRHYVGWSAYGSQKAAIDAFTRIVSKEIEGTLVRITAIAPGAVETHMQEAIRNSSLKHFPSRDKFIKMHEEKQIPAPEEVAGMFVDIALTDWRELSGMVDDIRSPTFQRLCEAHGVQLPRRFRS